MILLSDFLNELCDGEGSQTASVVTNSTGKLNPAKVNGIINILNSALNDIFTRFVVSKTEVILKTTRDVRDYKIDPENIYHPDTNPDGFILTDAPFRVHAITDVRTLEGKPLNLNQKDKLINDYVKYQYELNDGYIDLRNITNSFYTLSYNTLRVPAKLDNSEIIVTLRAGHPRIENIPDAEIETFDYDSVFIDLPENYRTALIYYTISRLMNAKGAQNLGQSMFHEGDNYYRKYLQECELLKSSDTEVSEVPDFKNHIKNYGFI